MKPSSILFGLIVFTLITFSCLEIVSAVECNAQLSWMQNASFYEMNATKTITQSSLNWAFFNGQNNSASFSNPGGGEFMSNLTDSICSPISSNCLNVTYNLTAHGLYTIFQLSYNVTPSLKFDVSNYSGVGFWYKGNGGGGLISIVELLKLPYLELKSISNHGVNESGCRLIYTDWRYCYMDFSMIKNGTMSQSIDYNLLSNVTRIDFVIWNYSTSQVINNFYMTNVSFVDFNKGSSYYPRWREHTDIHNDGRYQEGVYNLAYLYNYGNVGFQGNETLANYTIAQLDYLVQNQLYDGGWADDWGQSHSTAASQGFTGIAFMKAFLLMQTHSRMNEDLTMYHAYDGLSGNISTMTRLQWYNLTAYRTAQYNRPFGLSDFAINQYFGMYHARWLYGNYSGDNSYTNSVISNLSLADNLWQLNRFGFNIEENTSTNIGFDMGYKDVGLSVLFYFYQDSKLPVLSSIISKGEKMLLNTVNHGYGDLINGSRGSVHSVGVFDSYARKTADDLNLFYLKQSVYDSLYSTNGIGSSLGGSNLGGSAPYRSTHWVVGNYEYCSTLITDIGFRFPQNYSHYSYNMLNETSWVRNVKNQSGNISQRSGLEFPQIYYAWDDDGSYWALGEVNGVFNITNYDSVNNLVQSLMVTSALLTNGTSLCNGSSSNLAQNTGQVNITLLPSGSCYVFDSFNERTSLPLLQSLFSETQITNLYHQLGFNYPPIYIRDDTGISQTILRLLIGLLALVVCLASVVIAYTLLKQQEVISPELITKYGVVLLLIIILVGFLVDYIYSLL